MPDRNGSKSLSRCSGVIPRPRSCTEITPKLACTLTDSVMGCPTPCLDALDSRFVMTCPMRASSQ
ncbi:hypothetical protein WMF41_13985 [Sorangium sp. So ce1151]